MVSFTEVAEVARLRRLVSTSGALRNRFDRDQSKCAERWHRKGREDESSKRSPVLGRNRAVRLSQPVGRKEKSRSLAETLKAMNWLLFRDDAG